MAFFTFCFLASLLQSLDKQSESLLHFREAVKLSPENFEAQKGKYLSFMNLSTLCIIIKKISYNLKGESAEIITQRVKIAFLHL